MNVRRVRGVGSAALVCALCALGSACAQPAPRGGDDAAGRTATVKETEMETTSCRLDLRAAALPGRSEALAERERGEVEQYSAYVTGASLRSRGPAPLPSAGQLLEALAAGEGRAALGAALVAGRCRAEDAGIDERLTAALVTAASGAEGEDVRREAAMSALLRGAEPKPLLATLTAEASAAPVFPTAPWRAAGYLAQAGDPAGWPALVALIDTPNPKRAEAVSALAPFFALDGARVGESTVDAGARLPALATDPDAGVRARVPDLLALSGLPEARALLEALAGDPDVVVKTRAQAALRAMP